MQVSYCDRWNYSLGKLLRPLTEEQARAKHDAGELYTAVLGDPEKPDIVIQVRMETGYFGVSWLGENGLDEMSYTFAFAAGHPKDRVFLQKVRLPRYNDRELVYTEITRFSPDGRWSGIRTDLVTGETFTAEDTADVTNNWEPVPAFGDYASITRVERNRSVADQPRPT